MKQRNPFRQGPLERLSSPEQLDQLMQIIGPREWLPLATFGGLAVLGLLWSVFGRLPITVGGRGILLSPRTVVSLQSPISGQLQEVRARVGDCFNQDDDDGVDEPGEILATVDPSGLKQELQQQRGKLEELKRQDQEATDLEREGGELELRAIARQRESLQGQLRDARALTPLLQQGTAGAIARQKQTLEERLANLRTLTPTLRREAREAIARREATLQQRLADGKTLTPVLREKSLAALAGRRDSLEESLATTREFAPEIKDKSEEAIAQQRESLAQQLQDARELVPTLAERLEQRRSLYEEGAIAKDSLLQVEQEYRRNLQEVKNIEAELKQLEVEATRTEQNYRESLSAIDNIDAELEQLEVEAAEIRQQYLDNLSAISDIEAQLQQVEVEKTEAERRYLENLATIGDLQGELQQLEVEATEAERRYRENVNAISQLESELQELDSREKRLEREQLEGATARKNAIREGSDRLAQLEKQIADNSTIRSPHDGCIVELTANSGQIVSPGTPLGAMLVSSQGEVGDQMQGVIYFGVGEGKKIEPGMEISITPDTVERQRFGGIIGTVTAVSPLPVTRAEIGAVVGNAEIVENVVRAGVPAIQVFARLEVDGSTFSGYRWSSSGGPQRGISEGTTATARVTVEERSPISFLLPLLREWSGID